MIHGSISSANSSRSTSSLSSSVSRYIDFITCQFTLQAWCCVRLFPIASETWSGFRKQMHVFSHRPSLMDVILAGARAREIKSGLLVVKLITSIFSFLSSRTIPYPRSATHTGSNRINTIIITFNASSALTRFANDFFLIVIRPSNTSGTSSSNNFSRNRERCATKYFGVPLIISTRKTTARTLSPFWKSHCRFVPDFGKISSLPSSSITRVSFSRSGKLRRWWFRLHGLCIFWKYLLSPIPEHAPWDSDERPIQRVFQNPWNELLPTLLLPTSKVGLNSYSFRIFNLRTRIFYRAIFHN